MKTYVYLAIAFLIISGGAVGICHAGNMITVGISSGYPPYYYKNDDHYTGLCVEVVNEVAAQLGFEVTYKSFPWKRMLSSAKNGEVDAVMPLFRTQEQESYLYFDNLDVASETNSFFTLKSKKITYSGNFESLHSYRVGIVDGYSYGKAFDSYPRFKKVATLNEDHLIQMLKYDRFEVGVGNRSVILYYAGKQGIADDIYFLTPDITDNLLYIGFSRHAENSSLHLVFARALKQFQKTEKYTEILKKYLL